MSRFWRSLRAEVVAAVIVLVVVVPITVLAQAAAPSTTATPSSPSDAFSMQLVVSYFLSWVIQKIKMAKSIPVFAQGASIANRVLAWVFAFAQTVGIGWTYDTAAGTLLITGLSAAALVEFARAYIFQKLFYKWVMQPSPAEVAAVR